MSDRARRPPLVNLPSEFAPSLHSRQTSSPHNALSTARPTSRGYTPSVHAQNTSNHNDYMTGFTMQHSQNAFNYNSIYSQYHLPIVPQPASQHQYQIQPGASPVFNGTQSAHSNRHASPSGPSIASDLWLGSHAFNTSTPVGYYHQGYNQFNHAMIEEFQMPVVPVVHGSPLPQHYSVSPVSQPTLKQRSSTRMNCNRFGTSTQARYYHQGRNQFSHTPNGMIRDYQKPTIPVAAHEPPLPQHNSAWSPTVRLYGLHSETDHSSSTGVQRHPNKKSQLKKNFLLDELKSLLHSVEEIGEFAEEAELEALNQALAIRIPGVSALCPFSSSSQPSQHNLLGAAYVRLKAYSRVYKSGDEKFREEFDNILVRVYGERRHW